MTFTKDPNFKSIADINAEPNHLVHGDNAEHLVDLIWLYRTASYKVLVGLETFTRNYDFAFARDSGTGATNTTSANPNPLYSARGIESRIEGELRGWFKNLTVGMSFGYEFIQDTYQGYYSYSAPHPKTELDRILPGTAEVILNADLLWRRYGSGSYAATPAWQPGQTGHPPLESGNRNTDIRTQVSVSGRYPIMRGLTAIFRGDFLWRNTNFPNYDPGVFPLSRNYSIEWSYTNIKILTGLEFKM